MQTIDWYFQIAFFMNFTICKLCCIISFNNLFVCLNLSVQNTFYTDIKILIIIINCVNSYKLENQLLNLQFFT